MPGDAAIAAAGTTAAGIESVAPVALAALLLQVAQPASPAASERAPDPSEVTVVERGTEEQEEVPISSRIGRRVSDFAADPVAAMHLRDWANCIVRLHRARSLALLSTPLNSAEQTELIDQLTGRRFTRRTVCAGFRSMRVENLVLRGAVAEALQRWEEARRRSAGPLPAFLPPVPRSAGLQAQLATLGRCVVERDPAAVARVMATRPGTNSSARSLSALSELIHACLPSGIRARDIHPLALRGALGEPYYHSRRLAAGTPPAGTLPRL
jgi:hypothetical protein